MTVLHTFPPLQSAIAYAEAWKPYVDSCQIELNGPRAQAVIASAENYIRIGVTMGELLSSTWQAAFYTLFQPTLKPWNSAQEFEAFRHGTRAMFYTVREAMDRIRRVAESLHGVIGRKPEGMDRLLALIADARQLEENVFRDWPSFTESGLPTGSLSVDESLAEALGITVEEARLKMDARRRQLNASQE